MHGFSKRLKFSFCMRLLRVKTVIYSPPVISLVTIPTQFSCRLSLRCLLSLLYVSRMVSCQKNIVIMLFIRNVIFLCLIFSICDLNEPLYTKTYKMLGRKQRRRSASR